MPAANEDSEDVYATVDWDAVVAQLKAMGPPPARPRFEGEADHPIFREPSMDPVFKPDVDLAAPTEEDQRVFHLAPAFKYPADAKEIRHVDIIHIGAGMAGVYVSALARWRLKNFNLRIYERWSKNAGTWHENKYPGTRCDVPAHAYTWRWEPFPWSAEYAETDEIERYFDFMAKKYFLPGGVTYNATVQSATWHEDICKWEVRVAVKDPATGAVEERVDFADFVINGGGILHTPNVPKFEGMDQFKGRIMHSARYDRSVSLKDKVVAVVGNGSSGIGIIGTIKDEVKGLHAYQRRPTWIVAQLGQPDPTKLSSLIYGPEEKKQWADKKYWYDFYKNNWLNNDTIYPMFLKGSQESLFATAMARIMMENLVKDPELRKHLSPSYPVGCRRPTPHHGYFEALQLPKTQIIRSGVSRFTKNGIVDQDGVERPCDVVILATGYEVTYRPTFKITGRNGRVLQEEWKDCPEGFKAVMVSGYPNYFSIYGPIAPVASNSIHMISEQQVAWHIQAIGYLQSHGILAMDPKPEVQRAWNDEMDEGLSKTIWKLDCGSWYKHPSGKIISHYPGPSTAFMDMLKSPIWSEFNLTPDPKAGKGSDGNFMGSLLRLGAFAAVLSYLV